MPVSIPLDDMTTEEKLEAMELLWDDLCAQEQKVSMPQWHITLLQEREARVTAGKERFGIWKTPKSR